MKLFLILCVALLNFQISVQEGYQGTHVYHDGDEDHVHNPLPSDVDQLSRSREKRPVHTTANPLYDNEKPDENTNQNNEQSSANQGQTTANTNQDLKSKEINTTSKTTDVVPEKLTTIGQENEEPSISYVTTEKAATSGQQFGIPIASAVKPEESVTTEVISESPEINDQQQKNSVTSNNSSTNNSSTSDSKTGKIYETYPEAYEGITGNEYQGPSTSNGSNIEVGKIGQTDPEDKKPDDLEHGQKQTIYDDFATAYQNITGKHYEGLATKENASNESTGKLEHGQTQKIYDNYTTTYEQITGKHYEGSQSKNNNNSSVPSKIPSDNSQQNPSSANQDPAFNKENQKTSTEGHSSKIPGGISVLVEDSSVIYLPIRTVVQNLPCPSLGSSTPLSEQSTPKYNNARNSVTESTNELKSRHPQKLYDNYTTAYEAITGKKYEGAELPYDSTYSVVQI